MRNIIRIIFVFMLLGMSPAHAVDRIREYVPLAEKVGQGRLTYLFWDVYDAALFAPGGTWSASKPFALQLSYLREIEGKKIADRSAEEMRALGIQDEIKLADWHAQMLEIFPDVEEGVTLTGVHTADGQAIFYKDDVEIGRIQDPEFSDAFFNIWLSENTSAPDLRRKLLGSV